MSTTAFLMLCACIGFVGAFVWGSFARNLCGVNFGRVVCPRCLRSIPNPGGITGAQQMLFGGSSCTECKTLVDKWGREIMPRHIDRIRTNENKATENGRR